MATRIQRALQQNMTNGEGKLMMKCAIDFFLKKLGVYGSAYVCRIPSASDPTNTYYQLVTNSQFFHIFDLKRETNDDMTLNYVLCRESDNNKISSVSLAVSDVIFLNEKVPGDVVLLVECKIKDDFTHSTAQCTQQMLTQMHFKKHMFGIIICSDKFSVIFMVKENGEIRSYNFIDSFEIKKLRTRERHVFLPDKLTDFFDWLYWILDYHIIRRTKNK